MNNVNLIGEAFPSEGWETRWVDGVEVITKRPAAYADYTDQQLQSEQHY